jgi:hypothetical protein
MKRYKFKHTLWKQEELTYGEDCEVKKFFKDSWGNVEPTEDSIGDLIDKLYNEGGIAKLLPIVFKPYEPTIFKVSPYRWWNKFWAWHYKLNRKEIINHLPNTFIAEVMEDFFSFNPAYLTQLIGLATVLGLTDTTGMQEVLLSMKKRSTLYQMETSQKPN